MKNLLLLSLLVLAGGCRPSEPAVAAPDLPPVAVTTAVVQSGSHAQLRPLPGLVRPRAHARVAARVMGTVESATLAVGQTVQAGEVLVRLKAAELSAGLAEARAALGQAERDYDRETALAAQGASAADTARLAADQLRLARARVDAAAALLDYTAIAAPFAGVITEDLVNPGDLALPGQPLFAVESLADFRAEVPVPESLTTLPLGAGVRVQLDDQTVSGRLDEISPAADAVSRTRLARIALPATANVRSGQFVRALWPAAPADVLLVPATAVQPFGQLERVFVVTAGRAQLRLVRTGAVTGDTVQILSGLDAGETVVAHPPAALRDGQPLTVQP